MVLKLANGLDTFFSLSYLNPNKVPDAFTEIISIAPFNISMDFPDYMLKNYIDFGSELWASELDNSPRTTNGTENFHIHFNNQFYTSHIHQIIQILIEIKFIRI